MTDTPLLPGEPLSVSASELSWSDPVAVSDDGATPPSSDIVWVGFDIDDPPSRDEAEAAPLPQQPDADTSRRQGLSIGRGLRFAGGLMAAGVAAVLIYNVGQELAGLAGATPRPAGAAHRQAPLREASAFPRDATAVAPAPQPPPEPPALSGAAARYLARAEAGEAAAQYDLAVLYANGEGVGQDYAAAAVWFRRAALAGNPAAAFNLGVLYARGLGVQQNADEAARWYRSAANRNYPSAQYNLALAYAEGSGTPQDRVAAASWYHQAALRGVVPAMVNFAILYERGEGVEQSLPDAYAWYRAAAREGDGVAEQRARELFEQLSGPGKGRAVMQAAAVADAMREQAVAVPAQPTLRPPSAGRSGEVRRLPTGNWTGAATLAPGRPAPARQPPG